MRGGIVDIFSPAEERPVRLEFFGDEIDTMGYFDPVTQRRVENADELVILPVAETLPALHPGGIEGLARELDGLLAALRQAGVVCLKAVLTPDNRSWTPGRLYRELQREHRAMGRG